MALHGVGQCAVFIQSFNYIALPARGLCYFRLAVVQDDPQFHAQPYALESLRRPESGTRFSITPSKLLDSDSEYCSPSFYLKHSNEEIIIQDMCLFRLDLPLAARFHSKELMLIARLFFLPKRVDESEETTAQPLESFSLVATGQLNLRISDSGLHESFPMIFDHTHLVVCRLSVHIACIDYRVSVPEELYNVTTSQAFAKLIFGDLAYKPEIDKIEIERTYRICVHNLRVTHEQLRTILAALQVAASDQPSPTGRPPLAPPQPLQLPLLVKVGPAVIESSEVSNGIFMFSDQLPSWQPDKVANAIMKEIHEISLNLLMTFNMLLDWYRRKPEICYEQFYASFFEKISSQYAEFFFRETHYVESIPLRYQENIQHRHSQISSSHRKSNASSTLHPLPITSPIFLSPPSVMPIIFEDVYTTPTSPGRLLTPIRLSLQSDDLHVFVLVHGLGARSSDMGRLADHIYLLHPEAVVLMSALNEGLTDGDILEMGTRLAQEVHFFIRNVCQIEHSMQRLSFIGHSLGGLIIRAALPLLSDYQEKMYVYLSLSTPHLGCMYATSKIVAAGVWLYAKKWLSIQQMALKDNPDFATCVLYRLSNYEGLSWFKHIVLCSSPQDCYAPYSSARIEVSDEALKDGKRGCLHMEMALRLLENIQIHRLRRLDISFKFKKKDISSAIGRSAHVDMLQNEMVFKLILFRYPELFM